MNRRRALIAAAWLAGAAPLAAAAPSPATTASATLVAPRPGETLVAGETATLEWAPGPGMAWARHVEEWEAFLSLDGGAHYAIRLTPHLDRDLRRASFRVPDLPTGDARILLRFGDERRETACELRERFAIALPAGGAGAWALASAPVARTLRGGEPARPGAPGVSRWIEGSRRGAGAHEVETLPPPGAEGVCDPPESSRSIDALAPETAPDAEPAPPAAARSLDPLAPGRIERRPGAAAPPPLDILLLVHRRNE